MYARRCDDALAEDFPLVRKRLGAKPFAAAAAGYRLAVPSTSWALEHYGARFPAWLAGQPDLPPDAAALAQLERAQTQAHLARACPPLDVRALATLAAADQGRLVLHFAPATQLVQLDHAVLPAAPGPQAWLVTRARWQVRRRRLHPVEARLLAEFRTNMFVPLFLVQCLAARTARGKVINLLDRRIESDDPTCLPYLLSKKALAAFTRSAALELAPGITVNAVAPGAVLPPPGKGAQYLHDRSGRVPLKRRVKPSDVAEAVVALLRLDAVTGQIVFVDGGQHLLGNGVDL